MNLLVFTDSLHCGGAQRVVTILANHWARRGWRITVVTLAPLEQDFYELLPGVERISMNLIFEGGTLWRGLRNNIARLRELRSILASASPDAALAIMTTPTILLALARLGLPHFKCIGSERIFPPAVPTGLLWSFLRSKTYGLLDAVVAQTNECAEWIINNTNARSVSVIPNPCVYPLPMHEPSIAWPKEFEAKRVVLAVGRLIHQKNLVSLVRLFSRLCVDFPDWILVILGEGPDRHLLEAEVELLNIKNQVHIPGQVGNLSNWYESADIYVMSSLYEGFPNTLLEAMSYGLPAISYDCPTGPSDIIRNGIDGFLVPLDESTLFEEALRLLMSNDDLRFEMAQRASDTKDRFSLDAIAGKWETLLTSKKIKSIYTANC